MGAAPEHAFAAQAKAAGAKLAGSFPSLRNSLRRCSATSQIGTEAASVQRHATCLPSTEAQSRFPSHGSPGVATRVRSAVPTSSLYCRLQAPPATTKAPPAFDCPQSILLVPSALHYVVTPYKLPPSLPTDLPHELQSGHETERSATAGCHMPTERRRRRVAGALAGPGAAEVQGHEFQ